MSVRRLHQSYETLESHAESIDLSATEEALIDLAQRETSNSLKAAESFEHREDTAPDSTDLDTSAIRNELVSISPDLEDRWRGAIYSLNPKNPDAARHFCTSAREIFTEILELTAPNEEVLVQHPDCQKLEDGRPTRRAKIKCLLAAKGVYNVNLEAFVEDDLDNIIELFRVFNDGTHGRSGIFSIGQLNALRIRVENGIQYLHQIAV